MQLLHMKKSTFAVQISVGVVGMYERLLSEEAVK